MSNPNEHWNYGYCPDPQAYYNATNQTDFSATHADGDLFNFVDLSLAHPWGDTTVESQGVVPSASAASQQTLAPNAPTDKSAKSDENYIDLDEEEKAERERRKRNNEASVRSRLRRKKQRDELAANYDRRGEEIRKLNEKITKLQAEKTDLQTANTDSQTKIAQLQAKVTDMEATIEEKEAIIGELLFCTHKEESGLPPGSSSAQSDTAAGGPESNPSGTVYTDHDGGDDTGPFMQSGIMEWDDFVAQYNPNAPTPSDAGSNPGPP
ncbi:uncharacterized protein L203_105246 [Cryptococcus depauperatus CBS 7841]|uniref:Uncharacterized protein n=1 Tax=Cryptococcus depauperatus CBS 7841 TaxID=1295531 RepID=A0A1E3HYF6_9TREE|nr:hypothetical protein L203_05613 [Cryptococcus depauperatus CBS 7841]